MMFRLPVVPLVNEEDLTAVEHTTTTDAGPPLGDVVIVITPVEMLGPNVQDELWLQGRRVRIDRCPLVEGVVPDVLGNLVVPSSFSCSGFSDGT